MKFNALVKRTPTRITVNDIDPFYVEVEYNPRGIFKWNAACLKTVTEQNKYFDHSAEKWITTEVTVERYIDGTLRDTRWGAILWAKKVLRRERYLAAHPELSRNKNFIIR